MIILKKTNNYSDISLLEKWISTKWGKTDNKSAEIMDKFLPSPILAYDDNILIGGLKFDYYIRESDKEKTLWINAVYILPNKRKQGIASMLIKEAVDIATKTSYNELYVYTNIPDLYSKLDWEIIETNGDFKALKINL